ncbi:hypothetical protein DCS_01380 [Drechmeria coniospora]|uniref:Uncharacterized protein n=1 Tax=Drechmeria coniospora TaxID=98403 RepID=A0A151GT53_DRECN|nr:hypothetical protein DCS_01380 [Drechmeria coniospora]KYK60243.1 hypothetical protein DCS_01380 [Drechmeria coniospora]
MSATEHYSNVSAMVPGAARKRLREEDVVASSNCTGFVDHPNKRLHSLPLRSACRIMQQKCQSSFQVAPLTENANKANFQSHHVPWSSPPAPPAPLAATVLEQDTEMEMADASPPPHNEAADDRPYGHSADHIPTPVEASSVGTAVTGHNAEWAGRNPHVTQMNGVVNMGHHQTGFAESSVGHRAVGSYGNEGAFPLSGHVPSPPSEPTDSLQLQAFDSSSMMVDDETATSSRYTDMAPCSVDHANAMDIELPKIQRTSSSETGSTASSPGRRGHVRSKHTVNSWTWQPGMTKSFSIGYRSDCEKCRLKVPGHFNHIVIS